MGAQWPRDSTRARDLSARDEFCPKRQIHHALWYGSASESPSPCLSASDDFCPKRQNHHALWYGSRSESASPEAAGSGALLRRRCVLLRRCARNVPGWIRTIDLRLRRPLLYPTELPGQKCAMTNAQRSTRDARSIISSRDQQQRSARARRVRAVDSPCEVGARDNLSTSICVEGLDDP